MPNAMTQWTHQRHIEYAVVVSRLLTAAFAVSGAISAGDAEQPAATVDLAHGAACSGRRTAELSL
jgi:hypothetical protein